MSTHIFSHPCIYAIILTHFVVYYKSMSKRTRKPKAAAQPPPTLVKEVELTDAETTIAMMNALVDPPQKQQVELEVPSLVEMKTFLSTRVKDLDHAAKLALGNILVENNLQNELRAHAQGVIINMEKLPEYVIKSMYVYAQFKLK